MKVKKITTIFLTEIIMLAFVGCFNSSLTVLPSNPIVFTQYSVSNPKDVNDGYMAIDYNGRTYIPFGTLSGRITKADINKCLGYIDDGTDNERVCTLIADPNEDFLLIICENTVMDQPTFWRATDTARQQISIPGYIDDLGYDYWK